MKKLIIAGAIICATVMAQASSLKWGTAATLVDMNGATLKSSSLGAFTAVCTFFDASGEKITSVDSTYVAAAGTFTGTWTGASLNTSYFAQLVVTDGAGNTITSEKAALTTTGSATYTVNFSTGDKFATTGNKFDQSGTTHGWVAVPEPTSGLLLLLGVAGLALKRKRA